MLAGHCRCCEGKTCISFQAGKKYEQCLAPECDYQEWDGKPHMPPKDVKPEELSHMGMSGNVRLSVVDKAADDSAALRKALKAEVMAELRAEWEAEQRRLAAAAAAEEVSAPVAGKGKRASA